MCNCESLTINLKNLSGLLIFYCFSIRSDVPCISAYGPSLELLFRAGKNAYIVRNQKRQNSSFKLQYSYLYSFLEKYSH